MYDIEIRGLESDVRLLLTDLIMINTAGVLQELLTLHEYIASPSGISGCLTGTADSSRVHSLTLGN